VTNKVTEERVIAMIYLGTKIYCLIRLNVNTYSPLELFPMHAPIHTARKISNHPHAVHYRQGVCARHSVPQMVWVLGCLSFRKESDPGYERVCE
jgi:hypothetical protein